MRRLLAAGADPNASFIQDGDWLQVALYGAAGIAGDPELTRMLLEAGADPTDDRDGYHGNEVLYHACEFPDPTCAMLVIDAGARQDLVDYDLGRALNFPNPRWSRCSAPTARGPTPVTCTRRSGAGVRRGRSPRCSTPARRSMRPTSTA